MQLGIKFVSYSSGTLTRMLKRNIGWAGAGLLLFAVLLYQIPAVNSRVAWDTMRSDDRVQLEHSPTPVMPSSVKTSTNTQPSREPATSVGCRLSRSYRDVPSNA